MVDTSSARAGRGSTRLASPGDVRGPYSLVVISPHFDDAALCLGATIARESSRARRALVVDVFTQRPPTTGLTAFARFQHQQWGSGEPWLVRECEESQAMSVLGADHVWLDLPDAIYRGDLYASEEALFGAVSAGDVVAASLPGLLADLASRIAPTSIFAPLALGGHVDHRAVRDAALALTADGADVRLYEDVPYCLELGSTASAPPGRESILLAAHEAVSERDLATKVSAVLAYDSQVRWIFRDYGEPESCLRSLAASRAGGQGRLAEGCWRVAGPSAP
jgi:LmbE family N-acetylglucosaminyl deacetylase